METRKLQKVGGSTYTVSIPKDWAIEHRLEAGASVYVYTHDDGTLAVRSTEIDEESLESTTVKVNSSDPTRVERALRAAYAAGFEAVTLTTTEAFTSAQRRAATAVSNTLVGTEVVEETDTEITMQNFLDSAEVSLCQTVSQLQFLVGSMHRKTTEMAVDQTGETDSQLRDEEVTRLVEMITHHLSRSLTSLQEVDQLGIQRRAVFDYYVAARQLGSVANCAGNISRLADDATATVPDEMVDEIRTIATDSRRIVERATSAVITDAEIDPTQRILADCDDILTDIEAVERALFEERTAETYSLVQILQQLARTTTAGREIAEIALQRAVQADHHR